MNLADPATHAENDMGEVWRWLRDNRPVFRHESNGCYGFWVLTRYQDVLSAYRDTRRFTSGRGNMLTTLLNGGDTAAGKMVAVSDGIRHIKLKRVLMQAFSPRSLWMVADSLRTSTFALIREAVERRELDFARDVADRIPLTAICDLLGVPESDRELLLTLTHEALGSEEKNDAGRKSEAWNARNEILIYFARLATERRRIPLPDVTSLLANTTIDGTPLQEAEVVLNCYSVILGGNETSRLSIVGAVQALAGHPDQWERLRRGTAEIDAAVEEVLRWTTPALHGGRTAKQDVTVGDQLIREGDIVTLWNIAANFDDREFAEPTRFELMRAPNHHLSFGFGPHFCIGAYLARVEIAAVLTSLRDAVKTVEITGPPRHIYSTFLNGLSSLPVCLTV